MSRTVQIIEAEIGTIKFYCNGQRFLRGILTNYKFNGFGRVILTNWEFDYIPKLFFRKFNQKPI